MPIATSQKLPIFNPLIYPTVCQLMYTLGPITSNCGKWRFNVERYPRPLTDAHCSCQGGEVAKLFHPISLQYENAESGSDGGRNLFFVQLRMWSFLNGWVSIWCMNPCYLELNLEFSVRGVQPVDNGWKVESKTKEQMSDRNLLLRELFNLLGVFYVGCVQKICFMWQCFDSFC